MNFTFSIPLLIFVQGIVFGFLLLLKSTPKKPTKLLGFFILSLCADSLIGILFENGFIEKERRLQLIPVNFYFLLMPLLYLYTKNLFSPLSLWRDYKPLIAGGIEFLIRGGIFLLAMLSLDWFQNNLSFISLTIGIHFYAGLLYVIYYAYRIIKLVSNHQKQVGNFYSTVKGKLLNWIKLISWGMIIHVIILMISRSFARFHPNEGFVEVVSTIILINALLFFYWILYMGLQQSSLLGFKSLEINDENADDSLIVHTESKSTYQMLVNHMNDKSPYIDPNLTLSILADQVKVNSRRLAEIIKNESGKNFNQYVNAYRIEKAKAMLKNAEYDHLSILGIANESGFNSKATFNTRFKQYTDMTPSSFKKNRHNSSVEKHN